MQFNKKIFVGNNDVASSISDIKVAYERMGRRTITVMDRTATVLDRCEVEYNFTNYIKRMFTPIRPLWLREKLRELQHIDKRVWRKALKECDVFIFIWSTFSQDFSDIIELKKLGKKVIICFCGDDARWHYACKQEFEQYGFRSIEYDDDYNYGLKGLNLRLLRIRMAEKYADFVFSRLDQAQLQLRPYYRWHMFVDPLIVPFNVDQRREIPVIAHAPSHRKIKGTEFVLAAFDRLRSEGVKFETLLVENVPNAEAIKLYQNADILIDQLIIPGTGKLATEALAAGCVVMAHMAYENYPQHNPKVCPIIDVNPETIYQKLKDIIFNYELRVELAKRGRPYVFEYLDIKLFCQKVLTLCNGEKIDYDYEPNFFREKFIPESFESIECYNKWTELVKDCEWYQKHVIRGNRAGLIF